MASGTHPPLQGHRCRRVARIWGREHVKAVIFLSLVKYKLVDVVRLPGNPMSPRESICNVTNLKQSILR